MESMDRARTRQKVVHARALGDDRLRNRSSPGRHLPHGDARAGGSGNKQHRLLPRDYAEPQAGMDDRAPARATGRPIPASTFRPLPRSSGWSRTGPARNTALLRSTKTKRAATDTSGWGSARGGAGRSINSSLTRRRCRLHVDRDREQSVRKFPPTLRLFRRGKRRINPIFSVLFKLILDPGA